MITLREKLFDLLPNSLNWFLKEMYGDKSGEFVCCYWGLSYHPLNIAPVVLGAICSHRTDLGSAFLFSSEVEHLIPRGMNDKLRAQQWMILIQDHYRSCVSFSPHQARRKFLGKNSAQSVPLIEAPVNTRVRPLSRFFLYCYQC